MSQVMNALKQSDQSYQSHAAATQYVHIQAEYEKGYYRWYHTLFLVLPALLTVGVFTYKSVEEQQKRIADIANSPAPVEVVSASADYLQFPEFGVLKSTYLESAETERVLANNPVVVSEPADEIAPIVNVPAQPLPKESSSLNLSELDLSELSPALAMRVESALKGHSEKSNTQQTDNYQAISLVQNSDQFSGKLPAMDFQTHVYASNAKKRWIKMNGIEYQEGEQMPGGVELEAINPQATIVRFENQSIEIPALYTWKG